MKTVAKKRLFWYLKDGVELDLDNPSHKDMYVQQILSHGNTADIKEMLKILSLDAFRESFNRIKRFLPAEIRRFWEEGCGGIAEDSKRDTHFS